MGEKMFSPTLERGLSMQDCRVKYLSVFKNNQLTIRQSPSYFFK